MKQEYLYIFYKNNESGYEVMKVRLPKEKCEKFCLDKGFKNYKIMNLHSLLAYDLQLLTDIVYFNDRYYFFEDIIPYPNTVPQNIDKFEVYMNWEEEDRFGGVDYDEIYNGELLWTDIITTFSINPEMDELGIVAQYFIEDLPLFLDKLKKNNFAIYDNVEYSPFKWLCWLKNDKIRLIHQDYKDVIVKTKFDILVDKEVFFNVCEYMLKEMEIYSKKDLKRYQEYAIKKYGKINKNSIPYPSTKPLDIGKFEIRTEVNYNNNQDFEDTYNTKDELFTSVYAYLTLGDKEEEIVLIAQDFCQNFKQFLNELKNIENAVYDEYKYTETKLYGWIKDNKVRLIYQDFSDDEQEIIFDILVDKTWFFETANKAIDDTRKISESEEEKYNKYVKERDGTI